MVADEQAAELSFLAQGVYVELQTAYEHLNRELFDAKLPSCLITLQRATRSTGFFSAAEFAHSGGKLVDEIAMNPRYFGIRAIEDILSTLAHEMVHAWQFHFGSPGRCRYHNLEWSTVMQQIGLMPSHTGGPGGRKVGDHMSHYIIRGGPFEAACSALTTRDFTLSWADRFPPCLPQLGAAQSCQGSATGYAQAQSSPIAAHGTTGESTVGDKALRPAASAVKRTTSAQPTNRCNRVKYRCPNCLAQVWGKPQLRLLCGNAGCCGRALEASETFHRPQTDSCVTR
ncbi:MAG TPA: SprT-like domain-containing protein [Rhodanobacteraceae bacterium]|nr:SprT-like domain-containing protein [Rhodanobacteraceae bacterium]